MKNTRKNGGFIQIILIIIVVLVILGFFGLNITNVISSPTVQANLNWAWNIVLVLWSYVAGPITYIFSLIWGLIVTALGGTH